MSHSLQAAWAGALATLLLLSACSHGQEASPAGAASPAGGEPVLNVYNWSDFIDPAIVRGFEKEYGIKVNYDVYDSNELLETKLLTGHTSYDVVVPGGSYFERGLQAGVFRPLDPSLLSNLKNLDPEAARAAGAYDPEHRYAVPYMWLVTTGFGYDVDKIAARAPDAPVHRWRLFFDPAVLARFQNCGVSVLDSPADVIGSALLYLGKDPRGESLPDLEAAEKVLLAMRPYVRFINSSRYIDDLANGDICLALGWSGDIGAARYRAHQAGRTAHIAYSVPEEGALAMVDLLAIPADAPHVRNAHLFIDYLLRPDVAARNSQTVRYANSVAASIPLLSEELRNDAAVYPPPESRKLLHPDRPLSQEFTRAMMRVWTRFKTGG